MTQIKNIIWKRTIICLSVLLFFYGCDTISEDDRFIEMEKPEIVNTVLLEDFTGVSCKNCPLAHRYAEEAKKALGEKLIIVSIHVKLFSTTPSDFLTNVGTEYQQYFYPANDGYPAGMFSRQKLSNTYIETEASLWSNLINNRLSQKYKMNVDLELTSNYSAEDNSFSIESKITALSPPIDINLQLWLTESNIISPQVDGQNIIMNYEHNHVLRDAINGTWGEEIVQNLTIGSPISMVSEQYFLEGKNWIPGNMSIVGFLYERNSKEVLYVTEIPLIRDKN